MCHDIRNSQCHRKVDSKTNKRKMLVGDFERSDHALRLGPPHLLPFGIESWAKKIWKRTKLARFLIKSDKGPACVGGKL
jgi:hypothetical protein